MGAKDAITLVEEYRLADRDDVEAARWPSRSSNNKVFIVADEWKIKLVCTANAQQGIGLNSIGSDRK